MRSTKRFAAPNFAGQTSVFPLVDLEEGVSLVVLAGLKRELSDILGVDVDVVPASTLKTGVRDEVFAEAIPL